MDDSRIILMGVMIKKNKAIHSIFFSDMNLFCVEENETFKFVESE